MNLKLILRGLLQSALALTLLVGVCRIAHATDTAYAQAPLMNTIHESSAYVKDTQPPERIAGGVRPAETCSRVNGEWRREP